MLDKHSGDKRSPNNREGPVIRLYVPNDSACSVLRVRRPMMYGACDCNCG